MHLLKAVFDIETNSKDFQEFCADYYYEFNQNINEVDNSEVPDKCAQCGRWDCMTVDGCSYCGFNPLD